MSKTVDERVVEMRFDNKQFEANVKTSMSTLDKLKSSLKLGDASKGLENIDKASKNISFDTIASGVEALQKRFSTFGIVGMRVIQNITDSMMGLASKTTSFLTDGIIQGGKNRAMNLENAHFQLQGLLKDEEAVAAVMKNVSDSVDGTAYSLDSAAKVASQLAASGMRAGDQMFSSLRAVAGVAAMTNSEYDEIGRIFTKVAGQGRLMGDDLLSLSSRGMNAAATLGTYLHKSEAEVREMVSKGKLDFQTFAAAMDDAFGEHAKKANETFTGALSNIRAALARIGALFISPLVEQNGALVQLFNALRERINDVKNSIGPFADMVTNSVVKIANVLTEKIRNFDLADYTTSFYNVVETLKNIFSGIYSYVKPVGQAFKEVFLTFNSDDIANFSEKIKNLTDKFKLSEDKAKKLKSTFKGLFSILDIGVSIIKNVVSGFGQILSKLSGLGSGFLNISGSLGDWISKLRDSIKENNIFEKAINGVVKVITTAIEKIKEFKQYLSEKLNLFSFDSLTTVLKGIWNLITGIGKAVVQLASTFGHALGNAFKNGNINSLLDILNGGLFTSILLGIKKYISGITEKFDSTVTFIDRIKKILGSVEDALKSFQDNLKAGTLIKIATAIGILAASLLVISSIDPNRLTSSLGAITVLFGELVGAMALFNKIASKGNSSIKASASMVGMAFSVLILAKALKQIADLEWSGIAKGLVGVLGLMTIVVSAAKIMSTNTGKIKGGATQMVIMAAALKVLASVCRDLSTLKWSELGKGVTGIGAILLEFAGFQALMKKIDPKKMLSSATSLILIASAMEIFADVCSKFGQMQWGDLGKAGAAIAGILVLSAGFEALAGKGSKMLQSSTALVVIGAAMEIFADVCSKFGHMEWGQLSKAAAAITGLLTLASGFMLLSGLSNGMLRSVVSLTIIASAMEIFADVCSKFGQMQWEELGKAGVAITGILALVTGFSLLAGLAGSMLASSAALLIMATALAIITPVLTTLGGMTWEGIAKGLVAIAGAFVVIGVAGALLGPLVPVILGLSAAIALFGVGCLAVGAGILALSAAFTALATAGAAGATAFVAALTIITVGILQLIPSIVNELTAAVVAICDVIIQSAPAIGEAIKALILTAIDVLVECIPALADGLFKMILGVLDALAEYTPQIVSKIFEILIKVTESAAKALGTIDPMTFLAGVAAITALMLALNAMTALAAGAMVGVLALGAVISELAIVLAAIGALAQIPGLEWLVSEGGDFLQKIGTAIGQFIGGIVGGIAEGVTSTFPQIATNLSAFMTNLSPFIESAKNLDGSILTNVQTLAETILLLTGAGIIDGITSWLTGGSSLSSFGEQLIPFGEAIKEYGDAVAGINTSGIQQSVDAGKALAELANALPNSGGVAGFFAGENDIDEFAEKLVPFGEAIKEYGDTVAGINTSGIQQSVDAGKALSDLANALPNSGGVAGFFAGENDIDEFGEQLVTFGKSITAYGDAVANINVSGIQTSVTAGKALAELADALPNSGGVAGFFAGNNDMDTFGENLVKFGKSLADFSSTVSGINISGVTSQLKGLTTALTNLGNTGIDGFVKTFTNSGSKVKSAITSMVNNAISAINGSSGKFKSSGTKCMESLISALKSKSTTVTSTCKTALQLAASSIRGYYNSFYNAGSYVASGLTAGIRAGTSNAVAAARSMASQVTAAAKTNLNINSPSKVFMSIGKSVGEGFEKGISDKSQTSRVISSTVGLAGKVISSACDTLGINSPSRAFMAIGRYIGEGLAQGIRDSAWQAVYWTEDTAQKVIAVASKTFEDVEKWVEDAKAFDELSLAEELEIWEAVIEKYGEGTEERTKAEKKAYSVYKELQKENYENSKNWIDAEKEYNRLSLQEELEAWQRVQARYVEGTDERKEADKQVYKLKHELIDDSIEALEQEIANQDALIASLEEGTVAYANAVKERSHLNDKLLSAKYDNSMNWIDRQDTYNLWDGLADKLAAYTRVLKRHKKGTEEYEKAAKEIYNIEKEIYEARESYNEDVEKIQNEAAEKRIELEEEKADKIKEINEKLQSDIRAADEKYTSKLESRTKSLYDAYGLFDEVKEKETVNSATLIKNLQDQVNEFKDWQKTLDSLSARGLNESLVEELSEMGPSAIAEIKALSSMSDSQLQQYATLWSTKHKQAKNKAVEELEDLRIETNTEIRNLKIQANKDLDEYCNLWNEKMKTLNEDTSEQLDKLRKEFNKKVGLIKSNTEAEIKKMSETAQSIMREAGWDETGQAIVAGMSNGVGTGKTFIDKMKEVAINAVNAVKDVLEIHSPSRVFAELGMFMDEGIVVGLTKYSDRVSQASENVGRESISAISSSISRISDVINSDIAVEPTITPVIDLTNVRNGIGMINGVFGANRSMNLGMAIAANNQNGNSYQSELFGKMQDMAEKANSKLTSAIDSLRSDFNDMTSKLERMQVVLDSGALVGEIAPDMDSALGGLVKMNRRGVR